MKVSKAKLIASIRGEGEYQKSFARGMGHLFAQAEHCCLKELFKQGLRAGAALGVGAGGGSELLRARPFGRARLGATWAR